MPERLLQQLALVLSNPLSVAPNTQRRLAGKPKRYRIASLYVEAHSEQDPNPASRVMLPETRKVLGLRRARLNWTMNERVRRSKSVVTAVFTRELKRVGLGEMNIATWLKSDETTWSSKIVGGIILWERGGRRPVLEPALLTATVGRAPLTTCSSRTAPYSRLQDTRSLH